MKIKVDCGMIRKVLVCIILSFNILPWMNAKIVLPRLSPLPSSIVGNKIELSGQWLFSTHLSDSFFYRKPETDIKKIEVPGEWTMQGFTVGRHEIGTYYKNFFVPDTWSHNKRVKLRCNGVYSECEVYINGQKAGSHLGGFTAFELDVTRLLSFDRNNEISIGIRSHSIADSLASGSEYAVHDLGGITRDIYMYTLPEQNISKLDINTFFDASYQNAILKSDIEIANESDMDVLGGSLVLSLLDDNKAEITSRKVLIGKDKLFSGEVHQVSVEMAVSNPHKWDNEHPYLYILRCQLLNNQGDVLECVDRKVGFRQIEVRGNKVYVNNKRIKLRGVCRHEVMPLRGRSVNGKQWEEDIEKFRQGNVNYIRTSHYPPDEALLDVCDSLGMFVELEAPFCWAHKTVVPAKLVSEVITRQHIETVNQYRNHPSILMWSLGNESKKYNEYFSASAEVVREMDPTRPRIFSQWTPAGDNGQLEIGNHHYPGPKGADTYQKSKRPIIFDEFCHLNAYNRKELSADPGLRDTWGELLDVMWDKMYRCESILGGAIWAGIDDTFILPDGKIVGYGTWGPIDGWRREKPEYWGMKKAYSPVKIKLKGNYDIGTQSVSLKVENRFNFSNLSECQILWKLGQQSGVVTANIAPHESGVLQIPLKSETDSDCELLLTVEGPQKFIVDEYRFKIFPNEVKNIKDKNIKWKCKETDDEFIFISKQGKRISKYVIDKTNGRLRGLIPTLMVLPLNPDGEGIQMTGKEQHFTPYNPVCENWVACSIKSDLQLSEPHVKVRGYYNEAEGELVYHFTRTGKVRLSYVFEMKHTINPRQIGMVFTLPADYSQLSWNRRGYWTTYPDNHIGKTKGMAVAYNDSLPLCGMAGPTSLPLWSWSDDQTANGTNMFRSTKKNFSSVILSNGNAKNEFKVESIGKQSARCWKDGNSIKVLIAEYNNGGSDRFFNSHTRPDYKLLKKGSIIQGQIIFQIYSQRKQQK